MFLHDLPSTKVKPFLDAAYTLISADNKVGKEELDVLNLYCIELNLDKLPELQKADYGVLLKEFAELPAKVKKEIYFELFSLAYADSEYAEEEQTLLNKVQNMFEISDKDAELIQNIAIKLLYDYDQLGLILNG